MEIPIPEMNLIKENDQVIFRRENKLQVFQVKMKRQVFLDKFKFTLDGIIGHPFGTTFELADGQLVKTDASFLEEIKMEEEDKETASGKDNRELRGDESNQKLTQQQIEEMKQKGTAGQEIIQQLVENSETFKAKTVFSQAKYLKKKRKKHLFIATVLKPTARLLIEMLYSRSPDKICNLRVDSLSQILWYGNIHSGIKVAVVDSCRGLIVGSILERMGGCGKVLQLFPGSDLNRYVMDYFDFPKEYKDTLFSFPLNKLMDLKSNSSKVGECSSSQNKADSQITESEAKSSTDIIDKPVKEKDSQQLEKQTSSEPMNIAVTKTCSEESSSDLNNTSKTKTVDMDTGENVSDTKNDNSVEIANKDCTPSKKGNSKTPAQSGNSEIEMKEESVTDVKRKGKKKPPKSEEEKQKEQQQRLKQLEEAKAILLERNIDCLIVASKNHPTPIVMNLLEFMAPSRPVVVYSQYKEPLIDCYTKLKTSGLALKLKLTETWFREYQVLPARTHPNMQMTGTGGYLLTFTVVEKR